MECVTEPNLDSRRKHHKTKSEAFSLKSNNTNALKHFLNPEIEEIKKLEYFQPTKIKNSLFPAVKTSFRKFGNIANESK